MKASAASGKCFSTENEMTALNLGHFNLLEAIGEGGMGIVYRAFDPTLNREVAIKVLRDDVASDPHIRAEFLREARNAAGCTHPNIVQVYLVGEQDGQYFLVMELLKGQTLTQVIDGNGPLNEEQALEIAIEVAQALRAAYKNQLIHGDIKPGNIFVTDDLGCKVLDFGLAKLANVETVSSGNVWGSPHYISPERVGQRAEDFRSDLYSLGATLFHALAGRPPFDDHDPTELALKRLRDKPPLLRELRPLLTAKAEQVVNKMLNKSILLRYRDFDAVLADLHAAKTEATAKRLGVEMYPVNQPGWRKLRTDGTKPLVLLGVVAVIMIALSCALIWRELYREPAPKPTQIAPSNAALKQP